MFGNTTILRFNLRTDKGYCDNDDVIEFSEKQIQYYANKYNRPDIELQLSYIAYFCRYVVEKRPKTKNELNTLICNWLANTNYSVDNVNDLVIKLNPNAISYEKEVELRTLLY